MSFADALSWVPKSRHLAATLSRAHDFARGLAHQTVTLEHVLLALIEDAEASVVLRACQIDLARLKTDVDAHLVALPRAQLVVPEADRDLVRILDYAVAAAQQSRRREVNGAIVLAAIVGEGKSQAAAILQANGLTFAEAIRALQTANAAPKSPLPAASAAATEATEQILASTRRRLDANRLAPAGSQAPPEPPAMAMDSLSPWPETGPAAPMMTNGAAQPPPQHPASARSSRLPPPIPSVPGAPSAPQSAKSDGRAGPMPARELAGGLIEAIRSAGAALTQATSTPVPNSHEATADQRLQTNVAGPPFPDPDQLGPPRVEGMPAGPNASTAPPLRPAAFDPAKFVGSIPRTMWVGAPAAIEVRVARAEVAALASGLDGRSDVYQHSIIVTKAMALRLKAPDGGFFVETASPETQWIESSLGFLNDDYASWRWTVMPRRLGRQRLQLTVSARTIGSDGATAETALPDQTIEVTVRANRLRAVMRWSGWIMAAIVGGVLGKLGEAQWQAGIAALRRLME